MKASQEAAQKYLPLIMALAEGKILQFQYDNGRWDDYRQNEDIGFTHPPERYRVKPQCVDHYICYYLKESGVWGVYSTPMTEELLRETKATYLRRPDADLKNRFFVKKVTTLIEVGNEAQ